MKTGSAHPVHSDEAPKKAFYVSVTILISLIILVILGILGYFGARYVTKITVTNNKEGSKIISEKAQKTEARTSEKTQELKKEETNTLTESDKKTIKKLGLKFVKALALKDAETIIEMTAPEMKERWDYPEYRQNFQMYSSRATAPEKWEIIPVTDIPQERLEKEGYSKLARFSYDVYTYIKGGGGKIFTDDLRFGKTLGGKWVLLWVP